jgi:hypothetical protein
MSRNNLILVVKDKRLTKVWYYVIINANADTEWNGKFCKQKINMLKKKKLRTTNRSIALVLAHDKDKKIQTEYGVREITLFF